ncbi:MAG TPA: thioredoxin domain-containing protein [Pyrinomonadaceae bacterium]|nr:thioredoxin domain-containing protein [Pyrinomonadaceae bacterium]
MNLKYSAFLIGLLLLVVSGVAAQTTQRQPSTKPSPSPPTKPTTVTTAIPRPPRAPVPLAIVNGQTLTSADIDPEVREEVDRLDDNIADAKRQILEMQINTTLLQLEAERRRISTQQLYEAEIVKRVTKPSEAEIQKVMDENRERFHGIEPATVRSQVEDALRSEREGQLAEQLVTKLRVVHTVVPGANPATPNLGPSVVLATVGGRAITVGSLAERLKPIIYRLRFSAYLLQREAVDQTINNLLLLAEASRRNVPPEAIVRAEVSDKIRRPSETEVAKFYEDNKAQINSELDSVRNELAEYLVDQDQLRLENELALRLRANAKIQLLLTEPEQPVQIINVDGSPARGEVNAPVTVVKFTDFECSSCAAMHLILEEVLKSYGGKVRFVVRDFPLPRHQHARKAAEAARAAHAQGKFFEYTALLYQRQNALDIPSLKKYASELGLDRKLFDSALDSGTYEAQVRRGLEDGEVYGVTGTPTIFINGVRLRELSAEGLRNAIDRALKSPK